MCGGKKPQPIRRGTIHNTLDHKRECDCGELRGRSDTSGRELRTCNEQWTWWRTSWAQQIKRSKKRKNKCFGLRTVPVVRRQGTTLGETNSVKILGVTWSFADGFFVLSIKDKTAARRRKRSDVLDFPFHLRVLLCGSLLMPKVLYGIEVVDLTATQERTLRSSIVHAIWEKSDRARNPGLLFAFPVKSRVCDPAQAPPVRLNAFQRMVLSATKRQRHFRRGSIIENLLYLVKRLGISDEVTCGKMELQLRWRKS